MYRIQKEDWHSVANYLTMHRAPQDVIIGDGIYGDHGGGDGLRVEQGLGHYLGSQVAVIKAEPGLVDRLPADQRAHGTAWGVLWYQGQLADRSGLRNDIEFADFQDVLVLGVKHPSGSIPKDAATILEAILQVQPRPEAQIDLHLALAALYEADGNPDLAAQHALNAVASAPPGDTSVAAMIGKMAVDRQLRAARLARENGNVEQARAIYVGVLNGDLDPALRFDLLMEWGIMERFHTNPAKAVALFEQALALRPDDIEAHANHGATLLDIGQPEEAILEFDWVIDHAPTHYWAYYLGGLACQRIDNHEAALIIFRKALALASDDQTRQLAAQAAFASALSLKDCVTASDLLRQHSAAFTAPDQARQQLSGICP